MARSGALKVLEFKCASDAGRILVASTGIDISTTAADAATIAVPVDMVLYQFGVYVMESLSATATGTILLEAVDSPSTLPTSGTATTHATINLDSTDLASGNGTTAAAVASTGSEDIDAGDVVFAPTSTFPLLIPAPTILHVSWGTNSSIVGELAPFIICRWLTPDFRPASQWVSTV